jgi:hypothetical protein
MLRLKFLCKLRTVLCILLSLPAITLRLRVVARKLLRSASLHSVVCPLRSSVYPHYNVASPRRCEKKDL